MVGGGGIVILLIALFFGVDPQKIAALLGQVQGPNQPGQVDEKPNDPPRID